MTLFRYTLFKFLATFARVLFIFLGLLLVVGVVDETGSLGDQENISRAIYMAAIGQAETAYTILPLCVIIAAVSFFMAMSKSSELVAVRASGVSGFRFLIAPSLGAFFIGLVALAVLNPVVTWMTGQYDKENGRAPISAVLSLNGTDLWMRQSGPEGQTIVHALAALQSGRQLRGVSFIRFDALGTPLARIEALSAQLEPQAWILSGAAEWDLTLPNPQRQSKTLPDGTRIATDLSPDDLTSGFGKPNSVPIWSLPAHIESLEDAGFSARPYRVWLQSEMAKPLSLVVMVLVAAGFTMRHIRAGNRAQMALFAVLVGFGFFFLRSISEVLGQNGTVPVGLAAWGPTLAAILLAVSLLLHLEEG